VISHAAVAVAAGIAFAPRDIPDRFWPLAIACSVIPDADVIGFAFGIPYNHLLGHRGFFHSPFFALLMSIALLWLFFGDAGIFTRRWFFYFVFFFLLSASHGVLDALTNGGFGITLLSPFDNRRYFLPWRPIEVSPLGVKAFFSTWGLSVIKSEFLWIWVPSSLIALAARVIRTLAERH
jgi:inner membrane protein